MSIPLDRLYHYIENIAQDIYNDHVIIYRFWPHGSKKLEDLKILSNNLNWITGQLRPIIYAHDQEPLNYDLYSVPQIIDDDVDLHNFLESQSLMPAWSNLNFYRRTIFEKNILIHSEQNSIDVEKYQNDRFVTVYYWSHAVIARDWFRYAEHESFQKNIQKKFLIYNRSWSGTREYRMKFTELLIQNKLIEYCKTNFNPDDSGIHYLNYEFKNSCWKPNIALENHTVPTTATSNYSADFDANDYNSTEIEVVLETLFEDQRLHLTEKSLRPIACGQPFILASTKGSLQYLRSYGFKTFDSVWDESYDQIEDPQQRLTTIINLMKDISQWDTATHADKMARVKDIVDYNKKHFFSSEFFNSIVNELKSNLASAFFELTNVDNTDWLKNLIDRWEQLLVLSNQHDLSHVHWLKYVPEVLEIVKNLYNSKIQDRVITGSQSSPGEFSL